MVILAQDDLAALGVAPLAVAAENEGLRAERDAARRELREERQRADRVAVQLEALEAERDAMHAALQRTEQEAAAARSQVATQQEFLRRLVRELGEPTTRAARAEELRMASVPVFRPDPSTAALQLSHGGRRCRAVGVFPGHVAAVARDGLAAGRPQFTVRVVRAGPSLRIGVMVANAPTTGRPQDHGVFLRNQDGRVSHPRDTARPYCSAGPFKAGSRVTARLDFARRTVAFEVDGQDRGVVEGLRLPRGPLYPAAVFFSGEEEVEFEPCVTD